MKYCLFRKSSHTLFIRKVEAGRLINDQMKQYDVCSKDFNETSLHHLIQKGFSDNTRLKVIRT